MTRNLILMSHPMAIDVWCPISAGGLTGLTRRVVSVPDQDSILNRDSEFGSAPHLDVAHITSGSGSGQGSPVAPST